MTEELLSEGEIDWMRHSLMLTDYWLEKINERIRKGDVARDVGKKPLLEYESRVMRFVLSYVQWWPQFDGSAAVWFRYMRDHARLQIARYTDELGEAEFHTECKRLRDRRDKDDRRCSGIAWMIPNKETSR